jgi:Tol biopolymer transport system component
LTGLALATDDPVAVLKEEVADKGWLVYSSRGENGTWDLFLSRPDGSSARNITNTPNYEEAAPRFAPSGDRILYRRMAKGTTIDHDEWGFAGQLVIAKPDGSDARVMGEDGDFPWAVWSPDGKQISCLYRDCIRVINLATGETTKEMKRNGIYQQLFPSPDGKWFIGTGNIQSALWNVVRMNAETGDVNPVHIFQSCTPDWFNDSTRVLYSSRPANQKGANGYGYTQLWMANSDGTDARLVYGEDGMYIYSGATSPDDAYVIFSKCSENGGGAEKNGAPMFVMRMADTPAIGGKSEELRTLHTDTKDGPELKLAVGWEPHWTYADIGVRQ